MFENLLMVLVFLVSGLCAECIYTRLAHEKANGFLSIARIVLFSGLTLFVRTVITYAMGHGREVATDLFATSSNVLKYLLCSGVCCVLFPHIYLFIEKGILAPLQQKTK